MCLVRSRDTQKIFKTFQKEWTLKKDKILRVRIDNVLLDKLKANKNMSEFIRALVVEKLG